MLSIQHVQVFVVTIIVLNISFDKNLMRLRGIKQGNAIFPYCSYLQATEGRDETHAV